MKRAPSWGARGYEFHLRYPAEYVTVFTRRSTEAFNEGLFFVELVRNLSGIKDVVQRGFALAERLQPLEDEALISIIKGICDKAACGEADYVSLYSSIVRSDAFRLVLGPGRLSKLACVAREMEYYEIGALLFDSPSHPGGHHHYQPFLDGGLKETPLGMRKALARRPDFKLIQRIARDQDYRVIRVLLDNPRLTETDVIRIASTRPTSVKVIEEVYNHRRWITRHRIKRVIILNPYSPLGLSLRLLTFMAFEDLLEIVERPDLHPLLLKEASKFIAKKEAPEDTYFLDEVE